jgi:hypothetical protein
MWWRKRFLDLMEQQIAAMDRLCTMQHIMIQHMQHLLMLQDLTPQKLIIPDVFTNPIYHAFEEIDVSTIPKSLEGEKAGHVYLLVAENGWSKIGMSREVRLRIKQLKIQLPFRTKVVHIIPSDDVVWAERQLHNVFEDCRLMPKVPLKQRDYRGIIGKSAPILAEITIRKSQPTVALGVLGILIALYS